MSFKDFAAADVGNVFLNPSEFGDWKTIDGVQILVVEETDEIQRYAPPYARDVHDSGTYQSNVVLYLRESDLGYRPVQGQPLKYEGDVYEVMDVGHHMGMLRVVLEGNRA